MKIAIFGATGRTGQLLTQKALAAGHELRVLARTPAKLDIQNDGLTVVQGEVEDRQAVDQVIGGTEAVLNVMAPNLEGINNIIEASKNAGVNRLVTTGGGGVPMPGDEPTFMSKLFTGLLKLVSRSTYETGVAYVRAVQASDLDWTVVRVPMLTNDAAKGNLYIGKLGPEMNRSLTREDLADFVLKQATDTTYLRQAPVVTNR